jgi:hypothetical protein
MLSEHVSIVSVATSERRTMHSAMKLTILMLPFMAACQHRPAPHHLAIGQVAASQYGVLSVVYVTPAGPTSMSAPSVAARTVVALQPTQVPDSARQQAGVAPRALAGTAWKIQFPNSRTRSEITGSLFLFCKGERWQFAGERYGKGPQGRYSITDSVLTTVAEDGLVARYRMQWSANWLELVEGNQVMRLHYHGPSTC